MNTAALWFGQPVVERVGWTLLHFVWQGAAVAALAGVLLFALRRRSANARYVAALAGMAAMAACPVVTFLLVAVDGPADGRAAEIGVGPMEILDHGEWQAAGNGEPEWRERVRRSGGWPGDAGDEFDGGLEALAVGDVAGARHEAGPAAAERETGAESVAAVLLGRVSARVAPVVPWFVAAWLAGVMVLSVRLLAGWCCVERLRRRGTSAVGAEWEQRFRGLCERMGVRGAVAFFKSGLVRAPAAFGWLRPVILLPASGLTGLSPRELEALVLHELAHIRRHDYVVNLMQSVVETVLFYHPAVWWISRRVRIERENCCDDAVLAVAADRQEYARALLRVADADFRRHRSAELVTAAGGGELTQRIRRVLGLPPGRSRAGASWVGGLILLLVVLGLLAAAVVPEGGSARAADGEAEGGGSVAEVIGEAAVFEPEAKVQDAAAEDAEDDPLRRQVRAAVERGATYLARRQKADGQWSAGLGSYDAGVTALATLALLESGVEAKDPNVAAALEWLAKATPDRTYEVALQTLVFCRADAERFREAIGRNVEWLSRAQARDGEREGAWTYSQRLAAGLAGGDNSNTGFALWALDAAAAVGVRAEAEVWERGLAYLSQTQNADGSWAYVRQAASGTGSMTCSGIAGVAICAGRLAEARGVQAPEQVEAAERGFRWLTENFGVDHNPGSRNRWGLYYLNTLQRAARRTEREKVGERDWYEEGARHLLGTQREVGSWRGVGSIEDDEVIGTALALLFLGKGEGTPRQQDNAREPDDDAAAGRGPASNVRELAQAAAGTPEQIERVRELIHVLRHYRITSRNDEWAGAIRELVEIGKPAVPELVTELDRTDRDATLRALGFTLRAIGDPRAVPALIDAIPKTLRPPGSDFGIHIRDPDLREFMKQHQRYPEDREWIAYGRPVNEILDALSHLTGHHEPAEGQRDPLRHMFLRDGGPGPAEQRQPFEERRAHWQRWWAENAERFVRAGDLRAVERAAPGEDLVERAGLRRFGPLFPTGPDVRLGPVREVELQHQTYWDAKAFVDFDTGRVYEHLEGGTEGDGAGDHDYTSLWIEWLVQKGIDARHLGSIEGRDLHAWLIENGRWQTIDEEVRRGGALELGEASSYLTPFGQGRADFQPDRVGTFLFTTREGGRGIVQVFPAEAGSEARRLRYRMWIDPDAPQGSEPAAVRRREPGTAFGEVRTVTLETPGRGKEFLLKLETGEKVAAPDGLIPEDASATYAFSQDAVLVEWCRERGIDLGARASQIGFEDAGPDGPGGQPNRMVQLVGFEMVERRVLPGSFEEMTVEQAREILDRSAGAPQSKMVSLSPRVGSSAGRDTFVIRTRGGRVGLVQISETGREFESITLRWRLEAR